MILVFQSEGEYIKFNIDRKHKKLRLTSSKTNYVERPLAWRMLWDKCEYHKKNMKEDNSRCPECKKVVEKQDSTAEKLTDEQFKDMIKKQMNLYGYKLVKW